MRTTMIRRWRSISEPVFVGCSIPYIYGLVQFLVQDLLQDVRDRGCIVEILFGAGVGGADGVFPILLRTCLHV
jgi:hypothetical protein